ncbi:hypothetical protein LR48_Vigan03g077400 [Vigna angularis]|uniref:Uncharacterized protein n=1 Tax=Phaseolus angularis TaxID=3914 RepID=A0A0L9U3X5_PHAAN|nr:hypothetical protein LR48_Vigan03g077400 [Vigna angularis]
MTTQKWRPGNGVEMAQPGNVRGSDAVSRREWRPARLRLRDVTTLVRGGGSRALKIQFGAWRHCGLALAIRFRGFDLGLGDTAKTLDNKILPAIWNACWSDEKGREKVTEEATEALEILQEALKEKRFFGGESI